MDQELFTIPEVAARLKVTDAAVRKWIAQGRLAVVYVGADRRVTANAIDAFMKTSAERAAARKAARKGIDPESYTEENQQAPLRVARFAT